MRDVVFVAPLVGLHEHARVDAMPPELDAFFRQRGVIPTRFMSILGEHRLAEATIPIGANVLVLGDGRQGVAPSADGYRGGRAMTYITPRFVVLL